MQTESTSRNRRSGSGERFLHARYSRYVRCGGGEFSYGRKNWMDVGRIVLGNRECSSSLDEPVIKYGNDLELTDLSRQLVNFVSEYRRCITNGRLKAAFLMAMETERISREIQYRLNELQYPPKAA
jgi:hypothetical protein